MNRLTTRPLARPLARPVKRASRLAAALAACLALAACSSLIPKPPEYTGADSVDSIPAEAFVGSWKMIALNPVDDGEIPERQLTYAADGSYTGTVVPTADMASVMGSDPILLSGNWRVESGYLVHDNAELELPGDGMVARMAAAMMKSRPPIVARANVYERSAKRIVVVTDEGYANALERL